MPKLELPWVSRKEYNRVVEALKLAIIVIDSRPLPGNVRGCLEYVERTERVKRSVKP